MKGAREGWLSELPRVLLVSVIALPIVLPPAFLIAIALLVFYVMEMVSYLLLKLSAGTREKVGHPSSKEINKPSLDGKL